MNEIVKIDDLQVEVRRSNRRRTVDLTVDRLGNLIIAVPESLSESDIKKIIKQKQVWIYRTLARKEKAIHPKVDKEYVSGEGFYYLGKKYRLEVFRTEKNNSHVPSLQLLNGRFMLRQDSAEKGREQFIKWYTEKAQNWIGNAVDLLKERVGVNPIGIKIRDLKFRWGSCTPEGRINFHWRTILLPPEMIHYLILHELIHLKEHNHGSAFYEILERTVPDFREKEIWLERNGDLYVL